jgi:hypothetical protein
MYRPYSHISKLRPDTMMWWCWWLFARNNGQCCYFSVTGAKIAWRPIRKMLVCIKRVYDSIYQHLIESCIQENTFLLLNHVSIPKSTSRVCRINDQYVEFRYGFRTEFLVNTLASTKSQLYGKP